MKIFLLINIGKFVSFLSRLFNQGNGTTWSGHLALMFNKNFIKDILKKTDTKIVFIAGTNGKTTTAKMIAEILKNERKKIIQNTSGANLINGIASTLLLNTNIFGKIKADFGIFEIDENSLPLILKQITPFSVIILNLFRDQLDRYGELDSIAGKWKNSLSEIKSKTHLILNADDPLIAYLGDGLNSNIDVSYFGLNEKGTNKIQHAADSLYCPKCGHKLFYETVYYSHLGHWKCNACKLTRPKVSVVSFSSPLFGMYNRYNTLASVFLAKKLNIQDKKIKEALQKITPAFGRQEKIEINGKKVQIFLSKNPISFNQSLETIMEINNSARNLSCLFVLNDRIPDGRDVSWIWDIDMETYIEKFKNIFVSGDRLYDMALRLRYSFDSKKAQKIEICENLNEAILKGLEVINENETLFILPTYSAMLEVRKILTGKKIL